MEERAHLLEKALDITLARFAGLNDLISHQLLHLTHCCSIVGLNATTMGLQRCARGFVLSCMSFRIYNSG